MPAGLSLLYTIFSLLLSVCNEWIARFVDLRRRILREELDRLLGAAMVGKLRDHPLYRGQRAQCKEPEYLASTVFYLAYVDLAIDYTPPSTPGYPGDVTVKPQLSGPDRELAASLLLHTSNLEALQTRVANWFDLSMEQASGRCKKQIQTVNALLNLAVCAALNLDSVRIAWMFYNKAATFPIGWPGNLPIDFTDGLLRIVGILISAAAISLGAPFWFAMINKLINLRQTGLPPDESPTGRLVPH